MLSAGSSSRVEGGRERELEGDGVGCGEGSATAEEGRRNGRRLVLKREEEERFSRPGG